MAIVVNNLTCLTIETDVQVERNLKELKKVAIDIKKQMETLIEDIEKNGREFSVNRSGILGYQPLHLENANSKFMVEKEKFDRLKEVFEEQLGMTWEEYKGGEK